MNSNKRTRAKASPRPWFLNRWLLRFVAVLLLLVIVGAGFIWYAYRASQVVPEYYQMLLKQPIEQLAEAGDQFETEVLELQNVAIEMGEWEATFTQDQINGWLASDLPEKFPKSIPSQVSQPRVSLQQDELKIAFRFESKRLNAIVEVCGDAYCTEEINQVAIRIKYIKSGVISLPVSAWTDQISKILRRSDCPTTWTEEDGETIALVGVPRKLTDHSMQKRVVESIEVLEGKLVLRGVTLHPDDLEAYRQTRQEADENEKLDE